MAVVALMLLASSAWSGAAHADEAEARAAAKAKVERGAALLSGHDDAGALAAFEDAYRLFPSPKIFFDIGLATAGLDRNPDALRAFQRFLVEATDASPDLVARAKTQIQALLPKVAVVDVVCPRAGQEIIVDDGSVGRSPLAAPLYLNPGHHRLLARANDAAAPSTMTFDVSGGTRISVSVPDAPPPVPAAPPMATVPVAPPPLVDNHGPATSDQRPLYTKAWFWAAAAGVVAAVGVTLLLTVGKSTKDPTTSLMPMTLSGPQ